MSSPPPIMTPLLPHHHHHPLHVAQVLISTPAKPLHIARQLAPNASLFIQRRRGVFHELFGQQKASRQRIGDAHSVVFFLISISGSSAICGILFVSFPSLFEHFHRPKSSPIFVSVCNLVEICVILTCIILSHKSHSKTLPRKLGKMSHRYKCHQFT